MKLKKHDALRPLCWLLWSLLLSFEPLAFAQAKTNAVAVEVVATTNEVRTVTSLVQGLEKELTFGLDRVPALHQTFFGIPAYRYLAALIFLGLAFYASKIVDFVVGNLLKRWAARTPTQLDDLLIGVVHGPVKVVAFVIFMHLGLQMFPWPALVSTWISKGLVVAVAVALTYTALKCSDVLINYWRQRTKVKEDRLFNDQLFPVLSKTCKAFIIIVAVLVTCQNLKVDITAALASLSIGGLALGLAAQDTVANLFGAVAVFVDKPFRVGDRIKLDSIDGVVETIGLRSTRIRNLDGFLVTVPNKTMGNATITNVSRRPGIKTEMNIGLTYDTPTEKVRRALAILNEVYRNHPMTRELVISFNKFADSALNVNVVHWWANTDYNSYIQAMQEMNLAVKQRFDQEHIEFAFPTQTLYLKAEAEADGRPAPNPTLGSVSQAREKQSVT